MNSQAAILVVDDESVVCKGFERILSRQGYTVNYSTDPTEGLRLALGRSYDAVLLDLNMPDLDGLSLLEQLRREKPNVPVIVVTGYPSAESAAESMRLGAREYIAKPFSTKRITRSVKRALAKGRGDRDESTASGGFHTFGEPEEAHDAAPTVSRWKAAAGDYRFLDETWLRLREDGTALVGAFLPRPGANLFHQVVLPCVGGKVQQGLPLIAVEFEGGTTERPLSPLSGEVLEVNDSLRRGPTEAWDSPCQAFWVARVRPSNLEGDLEATKVREVLLFNTYSGGAPEQAARLIKLGCKVHAVTEEGDVLNALKTTGCGVLFLDALTLGDRGPRLASRVKRTHPDVRIIVLATWEHRWERDYRKAGIFYYASAPFADFEIVDILYSAFRVRQSFPAMLPESSSMPAAMSGLGMTNRHGLTVALLTEGPILQSRKGVGLELRQRLLEEAHPFEILRTADTSLLATHAGFQHLLDELGGCDMLVVLRTEDTGAVPGTVSVDGNSGLAQVGGEDRERITTLVVQPSGRRDGTLAFDARTDKALADHIIKCMNSLRNEERAP